MTTRRRNLADLVAVPAPEDTAPVHEPANQPASVPAPQDSKKVTVRMDPDFYRQVKTYAAAIDETIQDLIATALDEYLTRHPR